ncbi:MAG: DUF2269 family protein [Actinomycetota bacterium]
MYQWLVFVHLFGVFGFLATHGVSMAVSFRIRSERDPARVQALLALSSASITSFYISVLLLLAGGIAATFVGHLWSYGWIWASLALFVLISGAMFGMATPYYKRVRLISAAKVEGSKAVSDEQFAEVLSSGRPVTLAAIGGIGIALILYLMLFKPTLGIAPTAPEPQAGAGVRVTLSAGALAFSTDRLSAPASTPFALEFANKAAGVLHNVSIRDGSGKAVFTGTNVTGPKVIRYAIPALEAGEYTFVCDVHPRQMVGTLVAE